MLLVISNQVKVFQQTRKVCKIYCTRVESICATLASSTNCLIKRRHLIKFRWKATSNIWEPLLNERLCSDQLSMCARPTCETNWHSQLCTLLKLLRIYWTCCCVPLPTCTTWITAMSNLQMKRSNPNSNSHLSAQHPQHKPLNQHLQTKNRHQCLNKNR